MPSLAVPPTPVLAALLIQGQVARAMPGRVGRNTMGRVAPDTVVLGGLLMQALAALVMTGPVALVMRSREKTVVARRFAGRLRVRNGKTQLFGIHSPPVNPYR